VLGSLLLIAVTCAIGPTPNRATAQPRIEDQFIASDGIRIRYVDSGSGEPVVLIHSVSDSVEMWRDLGYLDAFGTGFRVIAVDLRGHGRSDKPPDPARYGMELVNDIVRLLDHLAIRRAHLLGYSLGGYIAGRVAASFPDRVLSVTFGGSSVMSPAIWATRFEGRVADIADALTGGDPRPLIARFTEASELERRAADLAARNDLSALAAAVRTFGAMTLTPAEIAALRMPILVITGSEDLPESRISAFEGLKPRPESVVIDGATHGGAQGALRRPEFVSAVRAFLLAHRSAQRPAPPSAEPSAQRVIPRTPSGDPDLTHPSTIQLPGGSIPNTCCTNTRATRAPIAMRNLSVRPVPGVRVNAAVRNHARLDRSSRRVSLEAEARL
jgi:pimeloyl-ACP methyl ester carboxylesterase